MTNSNPLMIQTKAFISELGQTLSPPNQNQYSSYKVLISAIAKAIPEPFKSLILHGVLYQCDTYFTPGSPLYPGYTLTDFQLGVATALLNGFATMPDTAALPTLTSAQQTSLQTNLATFLTDLSASPPVQSTLANDVKNLTALGSLGSPYDDLIGTIGVQYLNIFNPPNRDTFYYLGMTVGAARTAQYLVSPSYLDGSAYGDFEESLRVYGDLPSALASANTLNGQGAPPLDANDFLKLFDPVWGYMYLPDAGKSGDGSPQDWLHDIGVYFRDADPNVYNALPQNDKNVIQAFLNGTPPLFHISGDTMVSTWTNHPSGDQSGCWYYELYAGNGAFKSVMQAASDLFNLSIKMNPPG